MQSKEPTSFSLHSLEAELHRRESVLDRKRCPPADETSLTPLSRSGVTTPLVESYGGDPASSIELADLDTSVLIQTIKSAQKVI